MHDHSLTPAQQSILSDFRKQLYDESILRDGDTIGTDDNTLLRFLRARQFNVTRAKTMFADCQRWRKTVEDVGIDKLYEEMDPMDYPERKAVFDCWPLWWHHTDKQGRPVNIHFFGNLDLPKLYQTCTPQRHWHSIIVNGETLVREILPAASKKAGKKISSVVVIIDLKGFGLSQFWQMKSLARDAFQMSQDYYPETMGAVFIINAPSSFAFIYSVLKRWMAPETQEKVSILSHDYQSVLLSHIPPESLPKTYGGDCTCQEFEQEMDELGVELEELRCRYSCAGPWRDGREGWGPRSKRNQDVANSSGSQSSVGDGVEAE